MVRILSSITNLPTLPLQPLDVQQESFYYLLIVKTPLMVSEATMVSLEEGMPRVCPVGQWRLCKLLGLSLMATRRRPQLRISCP